MKRYKITIPCEKTGILTDVQCSYPLSFNDDTESFVGAAKGHYFPHIESSGTVTNGSKYSGNFKDPSDFNKVTTDDLKKLIPKATSVQEFEM